MSNCFGGGGKGQHRSKGPEAGSQGHIWERMSAEKQGEVTKGGPDKVNQAQKPDPGVEPNSAGHGGPLSSGVAQSCAFRGQNEQCQERGGGLVRSETT